MQLSALLALVGTALGHYTFPYTVYGGAEDTFFQHIRTTDNYNSQAPVTDVTSSNIRCYDGAHTASASTLPVTAGSTLSITADGAIYHPGVINVYMAQVPSGTDITTWEPTGAVWFKVYQMTATVNSNTGWTFPSQSMTTVSNIPIPASLPSGNYLLRLEQIALHVASSYGGAQFYIGCAQLSVSGGGNGTPGPLVAFPGEYTGYEPGILVDIYGPPYPSTYIQPGPPVWTGGGAVQTTPTTSPSRTSTPPHSTTTTTTTTSPPHLSTSTTPSSGCAAKYAQCGGQGWTGATCCTAGTCTSSSPYYSQCL